MLRILDLEDNLISNFDEIVNIADLEYLQVVNFKGNSFAKEPNYL